MSAAASPDRRSIAIDLLGGIWIVSAFGRRREADYARVARSAPADVVARQPIDRIPGLRGWDVAHLRHPERGRRSQGRSPAATSTIESPHGRTMDRASRSRPIDMPASPPSGPSPSLPARCGSWATRRLDADLVAERTRRCVRLGRRCRSRRPARADAWTVGGELRTAASGDRHRPEERRDAVGRGLGPGREPSWRTSPAAACSATPRHGGARPPPRRMSLPSGHMAVAGELLYTAGGRIWRYGVGMRTRRDGVELPTERPTGLHGRSRRRSQRSTYTIAHRPLEPSEPQKLAGIVSPVVSPNGRAVAFTAMGDLWCCRSAGLRYR